MRVIFAAGILFLASFSRASAPPYTGTVLHTATGTATQYLSGNMCVAASSNSAGTCAVNIDGAAATVTASTFTGTLNGLSPASNTFGSLVVTVPTQYATLPLAVAAIGTSSGTIILTANVAANGVVIPANVNVQIWKGGLITTTAGGVTFNGGFQAGLYQVFGGNLSVNFGNSNTVSAVYPEWWGAVGDGTTCDDAAVQQAVNRSQLHGGSRVIVSKSYGLCNTINLVQPSEQWVIEGWGGLPTVGSGNMDSHFRAVTPLNALFSLVPNATGNQIDTAAFRNLRFSLNGSTFAIAVATIQANTSGQNTLTVDHCAFEGPSNGFAVQVGPPGVHGCDGAPVTMVLNKVSVTNNEFTGVKGSVCLNALNAYGAIVAENQFTGGVQGSVYRSTQIYVNAWNDVRLLDNTFGGVITDTGAYNVVSNAGNMIIDGMTSEQARSISWEGSYSTNFEFQNQIKNFQANATDDIAGSSTTMIRVQQAASGFRFLFENVDTTTPGQIVPRNINNWAANSTYLNVNTSTNASGVVTNGRIINHGSSGLDIENGGLVAQYGVSASTLSGNGAAITNLTAANLVGGVPTASVNLSTVTTWLQTLLSSGPVPTNFVNLSTVTTSFATKASSGFNNDITTLNAATAINASFTVPSPSSATILGAAGVNGRFIAGQVNAADGADPTISQIAIKSASGVRTELAFRQLTQSLYEEGFLPNDPNFYLSNTAGVTYPGIGVSSVSLNLAYEGANGTYYGFSLGGNAPASKMHMSSGTFTIDGNAATSINVNGASFLGLSISTAAAGGAGSLVTVTCAASSSFALSGGCSCTGGVATTAEINMPNPTMTVPGTMPTGWQCQQSGTTGGTCAAFVLCSKIRF